MRRSATARHDLTTQEREDRSPSARSHPVRAVLAGSALSAAAYVVLAAGWFPAPLALVLAVALVCVVPSGRTLSRRVAVNGIAAVAFVPTTWLVGALSWANHGALAVALVLGALLARVLLADEPGAAARGLLPVVERADLLLLPAALVATAWSWRLLSARTPVGALEALLPGYDHASHFDMFEMIWRHGVTIDQLGTSPDGSAWEFASYPAGFHSFVASVAQLGWGLHPGDRASSLVTFAHVTAAVVIAGVVVATASLVSLLPRPRLLPLLPAVILLLTALLWLPGGPMLWHGFENFWLAGLLAACALLLAARALLAGRDDLGGLVAVVAAALGTAMNWMPLVTVCWVAPLAVLVLWWRTHGSVRSRAIGLVVCAVTVLVLLRTLWVLYSPTEVSRLIEATGGIETSPSGPFALAALLFIALSVALGNGPGRLRTPRLRRLRWCGLGVLSGAVVAVGFTMAQRSSTGSVEYYAIKMGLGVLLVATCWVAGMLAVLLDVLLPESGPARRGAWLRVPVVLLLCLASTQVVGFMTPALADMQARLGCTEKPGRPVQNHALARAILTAASSVGRGEAFETAYVATGHRHCHVVALPDDWFHALTGTLSSRAYDQTEVLDVGVTTAADAEAPARDALEREASLTVLVEPEQAVELRELLPDALADRVRTWGPQR